MATITQTINRQATTINGTEYTLESKQSDITIRSLKLWWKVLVSLQDDGYDTYFCLYCRRVTTGPLGGKVVITYAPYVSGLQASFTDQWSSGQRNYTDITTSTDGELICDAKISIAGRVTPYGPAKYKCMCSEVRDELGTFSSKITNVTDAFVLTFNPRKKIGTTFKLDFKINDSTDFSYTKFDGSTSYNYKTINEYYGGNINAPGLTSYSFTVQTPKTYRFSYTGRMNNESSGPVFEYSGGDTSATVQKNETWDSGRWTPKQNDYDASGYIGIKGTVTNIKSASTWHSAWKKSSTGSDPTCKITLPTITKEPTGYKFKSWMKDGVNIGNSGSSSASLSSNGTIYPAGTARTYSITFNINGATNNITPTYVSPIYGKTFGTDVSAPDAKLTWVQNRKKFIGWYHSSTYPDPEKPGAELYTDTIKDPVTYTNSSGSVTLYAVWENVENTLDLHYTNMDGLINEKRKYSYYGTNGQNKLPYYLVNPVWEDHAFLGWTKTKPGDWDDNHGVYESATDTNLIAIRESLTANYHIYENETEKYLDPTTGNWGITTTLYGIWLKSKISVCVSKSPSGESSWRAVEAVYVKTNDGWESVPSFNDIAVCTDKTGESSTWTTLNGTVVQ